MFKDVPTNHDPPVHHNKLHATGVSWAVLFINKERHKQTNKQTNQTKPTKPKQK